MRRCIGHMGKQWECNGISWGFDRNLGTSPTSTINPESE
jgi:hypothetical protein